LWDFADFHPFYRSSAVNKSELVAELSSRAGLSKAEASRAVDALFAVDGGIISTTLRNGNKVQITGFGSFEAKKREARKGRNPRTGKEIDIAASTSPVFRSGKSLKDSFGA
jgi:DNA-binding protein HU-beta